MTTISIHRWHSRYHAGQPQPPERVAAWNAALAHLEVGSLDALVSDDEWICVRRLALPLRIREHDRDVQTAHAWSESLAGRLALELRVGSPDNVVRYRDRRDALADFAYRAAVGDPRRAWAWRQMGVVGSSDDVAASRAAMIALAVRALVAEPAWIHPTLARLLGAECECGAWTAFAQALDAEQWHALLAASPRTRALERVTTFDMPRGGSAHEARGPLAQALLEWVRSHSHLAQRIQRVLAVLIAAEETPASATSEAATKRLSEALLQVRAVARSSAPVGIERASMRGTQPHETPFVGKAAGSRAVHRERIEPAQPEPLDADDSMRASVDAPEAPALPDAVERLATEWGGLLFLFNVLPKTGLIEACAEQLPTVLHHLAVVHLGIPPEDPAVRAFCGGLLPDGERAVEPAAHRLATRTAMDLRVTLKRRLDLEEGIDALAFTCRRRGMLSLEPGWIELAMDARMADVRLRRAGLDLNPGFLPWLGSVVRFRYE